MPDATIIPAEPAVETLLKAGKAMALPVTDYGGTPFVVVPKDYRVESLEKLLPAQFVAPQWVNQRVAFQDAGSFCDYVKQFKTFRTQIFGRVQDTGCSLEAVIDYHTPKAGRVEASAPERTAHRATLVLEQTAEWKAWMAKDRQKMAQTEFALFIEENDRVFRSPGGADLREMVLSLEGHCNARFNSAIRLQDGRVKISYEEDVEVRGSQGAATGHLELPGEFLCGIAPFEGMGPYEVRSR